MRKDTIVIALGIFIPFLLTMAIGELHVSVKADIADIRSALNTIRKEQDKLGDAIKGVGSIQEKAFGGMASNIQKIGSAIASSFVVSKIIDFGKSILGLSGNLEQNRIAFTTMLGSVEAANKMLKDLADFAKRTPFELVGLRDQAKQLLAFGFSAEEIMPTLQTLGDIAAGVGIDKLPRLTYALGQVKAAGRLLGPELRQLAETGVPVLDELVKVTGFAKSDIATHVGDLGISYAQLQQALSNLSAEGGRFNDLMADQSTTLLGSVSNLSDVRTQLRENIGNIFAPMATTIVQGISSILTSIQAWTKEHPTLTKAIAITGAALAALTVVVAGIGFILPTITLALGAFGLTLAAVAGPIGWVIGGILALTAAVTVYSKLTGESKDSTRELGRTHQDVSKDLKGNEEAQKKLNEQLKQGKITGVEYNKELQRLQDEMAGLKEESDSVPFSLEEIDRIITQLNDNQYKSQETIDALEKERQKALQDADAYYALAKAKLVSLQADRESKVEQLRKESKNIDQGLASTSQAGAVASNLGPSVIPLLDLAIDNQQKETDQLQKKIDSLTRDQEKLGGSGGSLGGGKGGGSSKNKAADEAKKAAEEKEKALAALGLDRQEINQTYKSEALKTEIRRQAIKDNLTDEKERAKALEQNRREQEKLEDDTRLRLIQNAIDRDLIEGKISKDRAELLKGQAKVKADADQEQTKSINEAADAMEEYKDKIEETIKKFADLKKQATDDLRQINQSLADLSTQKDEQIASRYVQVVNELKNTTGGSSEDAKKRNDLEAERQLILATTSQTILDQAIAYDKLSETQKLIQKNDEERAILLEKQAIAQAIANQETPTDGTTPVKNALSIDPETNKVFYENEKGSLVEITDVKNQEYARDLLNKQIALQQELLDEQNALNVKQSQYNGYVAGKTKLEADFTRFLKTQVDLQLVEVNKLIAAYQRAAAARAAAMGGGGGLPGREKGGDVQAGQPYIVGEKRPEVFVPGQSGMIIPSVGEYMNNVLSQMQYVTDRAMAQQMERQAQTIQNISQDRSINLHGGVHTGDIDGFKSWMDEMRWRLK